MRYKTSMVEAMISEIEQRKSYLNDAPIQSIYFGGGTPSLLNGEELEQIFNSIRQHFTIAPDAEITLEANPDDLSPDNVEMLRLSPINRLSIGIQSFFEEDLQFMNRAHSAQEAAQCLQLVQEAGFTNLSIDLIYGSPTTSDAHWEENLTKIFDFGIPHISCYCLTVEPGTALDHFVKKGKAKAVNEEQAARQFERLMEAMTERGYLHYEISNFALPSCFAQHNSNYWLGAHYLGIGPSAHSFNGHSRQWNVAHNAQYIQHIEKRTPFFEKEVLNSGQQYNEYILTALRTIWGANWQKIQKWEPAIQQHFKKKMDRFLMNKTVVEQDGIYTLTKKGKLLADNIAMELFVED